MNRRAFVSLVGGAAAATAWPAVAGAQQPRPVIGFLSSRAPADSVQLLAAFHRSLGEAGFVDGRNVAIEYRWAGGHYDPLPALASELVQRKVAVILALGGVPPAVAAKAATSATPVLFIVGSDPVGLGLVDSLNRPGGNITGVNILSGALTAKRLEVLHEFAPGAGVIACLVNPSTPEAPTQLADIDTAARAVGREALVLKASSDDELDVAFARLVAARAGALLVANDGFFAGQRARLIALSARHAIPAIYFLREFAADGGLMSYGNSLADAYHQLGTMTAKVLRGAKPADLPVQQATKVELVINLKTAKALGVTFPLTLLGRADEVIE